MQASFVQTSFLGGEWSPYAQGRLDDKQYREGMNVCVNGYPIDTGLWTRRQGTRFCATTRYGQQAWLLPMFFAETQPYTLEFTSNFLRMFQGTQLAGTNDVQTVISVSNANPAVVTTASAHGWSSGNMVYFIFSNSQGYPGAKYLFLRQFVITVTGSTTYTIADPITGVGVDGSTVSLNANVAQAVRVNEIASPYTGEQLTQINKVQAEGVLVTLHPQVAPQALVQTTAPAAGLFAQFTYGAATFIDGPYGDPNTVGVINPSAKTGSITLTSVGISPFASTDVGRQIRLFSEPLAWAVGTAYTTGNVVKGPDGLYYAALANSTGKQPDLNPTLWGVNPSGALWTWATISTFTSSSQVTATINGPDLLYTTSINVFRLGLYSATTGYPTCGIWHEGRLWLAGAQGNRIDASMNGLTLAPGTFQFSPTDSTGTVSDNSAIGYVFNAEDVDEIFWLLPDASGIVCGTQGGEWIIAASSLNDPLTPTSIQAHRRSKYKAANIQAVHAGMSVLFVQANQQRTIEYVADVFSGKYLGRNLNEKTKHLTTTGINQMAYQQDKAPILWERNGAGQLIGATYKRESSFTSEPPTFNGWHQHVLGSGRIVESLSVGPSVNGNLESLSMVTNQATLGASDFGVRMVEIMTDMFDENNKITDAWFLDEAVTPSAAVENGPPGTTVTFYGMPHLVGKTVQVFAGGLDLGDYVVGVDGSVVVPINTTGGQYSTGLFNDALLTQLLNSGVNYGSLAVPINQTVNVLNPNPGGQNIQSYISAKITTCTGIIDDFAHGQMITMWNGAGSNGGLAIFNRNTGAVIKDATAGTIIATTTNQPGSSSIPSGNAILGSDGFIYCNSDTSNSSVLRKIRQSDLSIVGTFGVGSGSFFIDNIHMARMSDAVVVNVAGRNYLVYTGLATKALSVIDVDHMSFAGHLTNYAENAIGQICMGENINTGPSPYAAIYSTSCPAADSTTAAGIYKTVISASASLYYIPASPPQIAYASLPVNAGINTVRLTQITPANVDAAWSHFRTFTGPAYDQVDGNLVCMCSTGDAATNTCYVIKINSKTGAIVWKVPITGAGTVANLIFRQTVIKNGLCIILNGGSATFNVINTSSGTLVSANTNPSLGLYSSADSNDVDGSLCSFGTWSGSTMTGVNGTVAFANQAFKIQTIANFGGQVTQTQSGSIPAVIGFTYTSQGQLLRPQAPDATGARNGPGFGKTRRLHRYSLLLASSQGLSVGTNFANVFPVPLRDFEGAPPYAPNQLFTGMMSETLDDSYSYDGRVAWQITRPYPCNIAAVGAMIETEDR